LVATCALGALAVVGTALCGRVEVLVRPVQIRFGPEGVPARVREVSYFGHDASVRLNLLPDGPTVVARVTGAEVPGPGDDVRLTVCGGVPVFPAPSG
jgi:iron(III) transport system ATP-binding protein